MNRHDIFKPFHTYLQWSQPNGHRPWYRDWFGSVREPAKRWLQWHTHTPKVHNLVSPAMLLQGMVHSRPVKHKKKNKDILLNNEQYKTSSNLVMYDYNRVKTFSFLKEKYKYLPEICYIKSHMSIAVPGEYHLKSKYSNWQSIQTTWYLRPYHTSTFSVNFCVSAWLWGSLYSPLGPQQCGVSIFVLIIFILILCYIGFIELDCGYWNIKQKRFM